MFNERQQRIIRFWLPCVLSGVVATLLLIVLGSTPIVRALGLGLVIVGMALALRRMGAALAFIGSMTLCLSPAFWTQTGGVQGEPATIVLAIGAGGLAVLLAILLSQRPYVALGLGIAVFAVLFFSQVGTPRSVRLTGFVASWLLYLLIDMLLLTNPHPEDNAPPILLDKPLAEGMSLVRPYHLYGILLLFGVGVINDPLLALLTPSIVLALLLARARLPLWYWLVLTAITALGVRGIIVDYFQAQHYFLLPDRWRDAERWLIQLGVVEAQFGWVGMALAVLGLTRLARWYPPLGGVTLLAYGAYTFFGLIYIGPRKEALLLPLFIIQVLWMTYAVFTVAEWIKRVLPARRRTIELTAQTAYALMPVILLLSRMRW